MVTKNAENRRSWQFIFQNRSDLSKDIEETFFITGGGGGSGKWPLVRTSFKAYRLTLAVFLKFIRDTFNVPMLPLLTKLPLMTNSVKFSHIITRMYQYLVSFGINVGMFMQIKHVFTI